MKKDCKSIARYIASRNGGFVHISEIIPLLDGAFCEGALITGEEITRSIRGMDESVRQTRDKYDEMIDNILAALKEQ